MFFALVVFFCFFWVCVFGVFLFLFCVFCVFCCLVFFFVFFWGLFGVVLCCFVFCLRVWVYFDVFFFFFFFFRGSLVEIVSKWFFGVFL